LIEHRSHQIALLDADAVLAGEYAPDLDAEFEDLRSERLGPLQLARRIGVVENQRMQVAIAGVKYIGYPQAVSSRHLLHPVQHLGQASARDGAVHAVVVGRNAADGWKGSLASRPELCPLLLGTAGAQIDRAPVATDPLHHG